MRPRFSRTRTGRAGGRREDASLLLRRTIARSPDPVHDLPLSYWVVPLAISTEADLAEAARARRDRASVEAARDRGRRLVPAAAENAAGAIRPRRVGGHGHGVRSGRGAVRPRGCAVPRGRGVAVIRRRPGEGDRRAARGRRDRRAARGPPPSWGVGGPRGP